MQIEKIAFILEYILFFFIQEGKDYWIEMTLSPAKKTHSQGGKKINTREKKEDGH